MFGPGLKGFNVTMILFDKFITYSSKQSNILLCITCKENKDIICI